MSTSLQFPDFKDPENVLLFSYLTTYYSEVDRDTPLKQNLTIWNIILVQLPLRFDTPEKNTKHLSQVLVLNHPLNSF